MAVGEGVESGRGIAGVSLMAGIELPDPGEALGFPAGAFGGVNTLDGKEQGGSEELHREMDFQW